jgi:ubiquinol-cytochrome c reductase cytochrome c subunit
VSAAEQDRRAAAGPEPLAGGTPDAPDPSRAAEAGSATRGRGSLIGFLRRPSRFPRPLRFGIAAALALSAIVLWSAPQRARATSSGATPTIPTTIQPPPKVSPLTPPPPLSKFKRVIVAKPTKRPQPPGKGSTTQHVPTSPMLVAEGYDLYHEDCASCHGLMLQGRKGIAPSLIDVGEGPPLFYLTTGRMPLSNPTIEPLHQRPLFTRPEIDALVDFIHEYGGGPLAPSANPAKGSLSVGFNVFTLNCAGCHQILAHGGMTIDDAVPMLDDVSADQIAEAVRFGPFVMPHFDARYIDQKQLDSLARYILYTRHPINAGGWSIYNIGPIPEGMVAWFLGLFSLMIVARLIGERTA